MLAITVQRVRAHHVEHAAGELGAAGAAGEERYRQSSSGRPVSFMPAWVLWRMFTEISSGVRPSTSRAASSLPAFTGRRPVDQRDQLGHPALGVPVVAGHQHVLVELLVQVGERRPRPPCAGR